MKSHKLFIFLLAGLFCSAVVVPAVGSVELDEKTHEELIQLASKSGDETLIEYIGTVGESTHCLPDALYIAAEIGEAEIVKKLFDAGVRPEEQKLNEAMIEAVWNGHRDVVKILLEKGVKTSLTHISAGERFSLLSIALAQDDEEVPRLLLHHGATAELSDLNKAVEKGLAEVQSLIMEQMGDALTNLSWSDRVHGLHWIFYYAKKKGLYEKLTPDLKEIVDKHWKEKEDIEERTKKYEKRVAEIEEEVASLQSKLRRAISNRAAEEYFTMQVGNAPGSSKHVARGKEALFARQLKDYVEGYEKKKDAIHAYVEESKKAYRYWQNIESEYKDLNEMMEIRSKNLPAGYLTEDLRLKIKEGYSKYQASGDEFNRGNLEKRQEVLAAHTKMLTDTKTKLEQRLFPILHQVLNENADHNYASTAENDLEYYRENKGAPALRGLYKTMVYNLPPAKKFPALPEPVGKDKDDEPGEPVVVEDGFKPSHIMIGGGLAIGAILIPAIIYRIYKRRKAEKEKLEAQLLEEDDDELREEDLEPVM